MKKISIILPCYNEEKALPCYFDAVDKIIPEIKDYHLEFVLVNDGSKDDTLSVMNDLYLKRNDIMVVNLSRNYGQNAAFSAGLKACDGDYAIMMDSDLQDPVELIIQIAEKFSQGYEVVNPHRADRSTDSYFKRKTAAMYYDLVNKLEGKEVAPVNVNCFRGISRRAIDEINALSEKDRQIRAEIPLVGFKTCQIDFRREKRVAGESKFNFKKMFLYALDNISSVTARPLYYPIIWGAITSALSFVFFITMMVLFIISCNSAAVSYMVFMPLFIISAVCLSFSILLFVIGLLGLYLHNILINTRNRPSFIIDVVKKPSDKDSKEETK